MRRVDADHARLQQHTELQLVRPSEAGLVPGRVRRQPSTSCQVTETAISMLLRRTSSPVPVARPCEMKMPGVHRPRRSGADVAVVIAERVVQRLVVERRADAGRERIGPDRVQPAAVACCRHRPAPARWRCRRPRCWSSDSRPTGRSLRPGARSLRRPFALISALVAFERVVERHPAGVEDLVIVDLRGAAVDAELALGLAVAAEEPEPVADDRATDRERPLA